MKYFVAFLAILMIAVIAQAEGPLPKDSSGRHAIQGICPSTISSANPGTKGTATVSTVGKVGMYYTCTTTPTSTTATTVKVGRNGSVANFYPSSSGTLFFGKDTGTSSIAFGAYSSANNTTCHYVTW